MKKLAKDCEHLTEIEDDDERRICIAITRDARALFTLVVEYRGQISWQIDRSGRASEHMIDAAEHCVRLGLARARRATDSFNPNRPATVFVTAKVSAAQQLQRIFEKYPNVGSWIREVPS